MKRRIVGYVFAVVFIIAGWWITALLLNSPALPTPDEAARVLMHNASTLVPFFATSTYRVVAGLAIGTVLAVPIAQVFARSRTLDSLFAPVLYLLYPIPKVVLLPILLVLLGLADAPKIALIALTVFFQPCSHRCASAWEPRSRCCSSPRPWRGRQGWDTSSCNRGAW